MYTDYNAIFTNARRCRHSKHQTVVNVFSPRKHHSMLTKNKAEFSP